MPTFTLLFYFPLAAKPQRRVSLPGEVRGESLQHLLLAEVQLVHRAEEERPTQSRTQHPRWPEGHLLPAEACRQRVKDPEAALLEGSRQQGGLRPGILHPGKVMTKSSAVGPASGDGDEAKHVNDVPENASEKLFFLGFMTHLLIG